MADSTSTLSISSNASTVADSSCFRRTVCLYDWWLIKAESDFEGKWLAVSGITSEKEKAIRVFVSAPVTKRYDLLSLETADGIYIMIRGFINEQRTLENGFPAEVFNNFIFGFPPNWESFGVDWFRHEASTGIDLGSAVPEKVSPIDSEVLSDGVEKSMPTSLKSPVVSLRAHRKPLLIEECHAFKETMGGVNVALGSGSNRRSTRLHDIKVSQQKQPASEVARKHPGKKQHYSPRALENPDGEGLESLMAPIQSQSLRQVNTQSNKLIKNSSAIDPEVISDGVEKSIPVSLKSLEEALGAHERSFPTEECHASKEKTSGDNVALGSGSNRRSMRLHNVKVCQQKKPASEVAHKHPGKEQHPPSSGALENPDGEGLESLMEPVQSQSLRQVNTPSNKLIKNSSSAIDQKFLFDGVEKSIPTSSKSPEEALGTHKKPFPTEECHASKKTTGGDNAALVSGSNRRSTRLHNIKVSLVKKPAFEVARKHPGKEQHSSSGALENPDGEGLESLMAPVQSQSLRQVNTPSNKLTKSSSSAIDPKVLFDENSIPTCLKSPKEALGAHERTLPTEKSHVSKETTGGDNVALGSGSNRRSMRLHNVKVCQRKKPASEVAHKHPGKEQHSSSGALENPDGEGLESFMAPVLSQSPREVNTPSSKLIKNSSSAIDPKVLFDGVAKSIPTSSKSPKHAMGANEKPFPTEECDASKETTCGVNVALGSGSKRRSKQLHNIKVCLPKKPASEVAWKHPGEEEHSSSGSLEILDGEGLESPMTPVQSQSPAQVNTQSRKLLKSSASRVSRPFSAKDEASSKKQKVTVETKVITPKRKRAGSASAVKYLHERDIDPLIKGGKEKISSVSPLSSSFRKSRSGRLLLPPLEFWRNQIAIYNADHEVTEIQEGVSVVSALKVLCHH